MALKYINFITIPVTDQDRALAFYRDKLGFTVQVDAPYEPDWRWIFMTLPDSQARLQFGKTSDFKVSPGQPALTLVADDVDQEAARLKAAGVAIEQGPGDAPWAAGVRWLLIRDSEGNRVLLESMKGG
jgi:catechol 2,3-dioxygenase-like lactoylglutathione lyase family enzyme